jgi:dipeptidyl aminopeptidase/acylaminoacyl peptidase
LAESFNTNKIMRRIHPFPYIALKKPGVDTQLIVCPGEFHGGFSPSHPMDHYQRHIDWFGEYLSSK